MSKIAFVTPWYGQNIPGGAEALTRRTAEKLHQANLEIEVLTTCIKDIYADWGHNYHKAGVTEVNGVTVRRFPVQGRNRQAFDQLNWRLMNGLTLTAKEEQTFIHEMIQSPALYDYMARHVPEYLFIFIPYMFATTYYGLQVCPERSLVIPCLHDEGYARLNIYRQLLPRAKALLFLNEAEMELADRFFGQAKGQIREVLGTGVDTDFTADAGRFRQKYGLTSPFVLYAGRREPGKNTPLLLDFWQRYVQEEKRDVKLLLIGGGEVTIPSQLQAHVWDLGFVSSQDKYDAYAAAAVFCLPSINESFSIVIMESWLARTPVLVHGRCAVTREHCRRANGGLYFTDYWEFAATLNFLLDHSETAVQMARQGRRYVLDNFHWNIITNKYKQLITAILSS